MSEKQKPCYRLCSSDSVECICKNPREIWVYRPEETDYRDISFGPIKPDYDIDYVHFREVLPGFVEPAVRQAHDALKREVELARSPYTRTVQAIAALELAFPELKGPKEEK